MIKILICLLLILPSTGKTQVIDFRMLAGVAVGEGKTDKQLMLCRGQTISYEFTSHHKFYLNMGWGWGQFIFNQTELTGNTYLFKKKYLQLPVHARYYELLKGNAACFVEFGPLLTYYYKDVAERKAPDLTEKSTSSQVNFGVSASAGYKSRFNKSLGFEFGISAQNDLVKMNKQENPSFQSNRVQMFFSVTYKTK